MKNKRMLIGTIGLAAAIVLVLLGWQLLNPSVSLAEEDARRIVLEKYAGEIIGTTKNNGAYLVELATDAGVYHVEVNADNGKIRSIAQLAWHDLEPDLTEGDLASLDPIEPETTTEPATGATTEQTQDPAKKPSKDTAKQPTKEPVNEPSTEPNKQPDKESTKQSSKQSTTNEPAGPATGANEPDNTGDGTNHALISEQEAIAVAEQNTGGEADDVDLIFPDDASPYYLVEVEWDDDDLDLEAIVQIDAYTREVKSVTWEDD